MIYERISYDGGSLVTEYSNVDSFIVGSPSAEVILSGGGFFGPYFAAYSGNIYGKFGPGGPSTTSISEWSATDGALLQTTNIPLISGNNSPNNVIDWGGYSGPSVIEDQTGLYVLGNINLNIWQITKLNSNDTIASSETFASGALGFAFMIGGVLFLGKASYESVINEEFNFATNTLTQVNIKFAPPGYISDMVYDPTSDALFFVESNTQALYEIANASVAFGVVDVTPTVTERLVHDTGTSTSDNKTADDALSGTADASAVVTLTIDGSTTVTTTADGTGAWSYTPTELADGSHTIVASETDAAGNTGSASLSFTLDTTLPTIAINPVATNPVNLTTALNMVSPSPVPHPMRVLASKASLPRCRSSPTWDSMLSEATAPSSRGARGRCRFLPGTPSACPMAATRRMRRPPTSPAISTGFTRAGSPLMKHRRW
jgi:Bacterial Ig-like domain/Olfactomedin-like domain